MKTLLVIPLLAALLALAAHAAPEPWEPGGDDDRLAVIAAAPGDEARFCAGVLQEFDALDLPAHVFFAAAPASPAPVLAADAALARPPDAFDVLSDPAAQLPALLPAFAPSHLVLTQPTPVLLDLVAAAFPDPATQPLLLVPSGDADSADFLFALTRAQSAAKAKALRAYSLPPPSSDSEAFLELEFDPYAAAVAAIAPAPPPAAPSPAPVAAPAAAPSPAPAAAPEPSPSPSPAARLLPRTRLPAPAPAPPPKRRPPPSSWDAPVFW